MNHEAQGDSGLLSSNKQTLLEAKALIKQGRYRQAHSLLSFVDSPTARKWQAKLEQIMDGEVTLDGAPPSTRKKQAKKRRDLIDEDVYQRKLKNVRSLKYQPWNPWLLFILGLLGNILLAFNWRRFKKTEWMRYTLLAPIFWVLSIVVMVFALAPLPSTPTSQQILYGRIGIYLAASLSGLYAALFVFMTALQGQALRAYSKRPTAETLYGHRYRVTVPLLISALPALLIVPFMVSLLSEDVLPNTYENQEVSLSAPAAWESQFCPTGEWECLISVKWESDMYYDEYAAATVIRYQPGQWESIAHIEETKRVNWEANRTGNILAVTDSISKGMPTRSRTAQYYKEDLNCMAHVEQVYMMRGDTVYQFTLLASCDWVWRDRNEELSYIFDSAVFS